MGSPPSFCPLCDLTNGEAAALSRNGGPMPFRLLRISVLAIGLATPVLGAQVPLAFDRLESPTTLRPSLHDAVVAKAATYPFIGFRMLGRDSVILVFEDSTLTLEALRAGTWMFG